MKIRIRFDANDFRLGLAWDRHRRAFIVALPFLALVLELGGGVVTRTPELTPPSTPDGFHPDDKVLLTAVQRDPHLHWQELRKRMPLTATQAALSRTRLLNAGVLVEARNPDGKRCLTVKL